MDITLGEFEEFGSRSSRPSTRSSLRSETMSSMEILSPEENTDQLFMSEELDSEDDTGGEGTITPVISNTDSRPSTQRGQSKKSKSKHKLASREREKDARSESRSSSETIETLFPDIDDPKLREAIKKMRKYDKILTKKIKREKEVKKQRLLFQKQLIVQLATPEPVRDEASANTVKYLALMPPSERLEELLGQVDADEFTPIFPTQISTEDHETKSPTSHPLPSDNPKVGEDESPLTDDSENADTRKQHKSKTDFIKRNIELAKDAGSMVSMTDDEKKRLNELLSDLDALELTDSEMEDTAFTTMAVQAGEGYTPSEEGQKRLAEIDAQIKFLMPPTDTEEIPAFSRFPKLDIKPIVIAHDDSGDDGGDRLRMIEDKLNSLDDEWRDLYDGTGPRLTDAALQKLLSECGCSSSRLSSRFSLTPNSSVRATPRVESSAASDFAEPEFDAASEDDSHSEYSVERPLSRETLDSLLAEARSSLGISRHDDDRIGIFSGETTPTPSSEEEDYEDYVDPPLFHSSSKERPDSGGSGSSDLDVEDLEDT